MRKPKAIGPSAMPWHPSDYSKADAYAIKAMNEGNANEAQQKRALDYIMRVCGVRDLEFRPDSDRASAFASGKRFVGLQLAKLMTLPASVLDKLDDA